MEAMTGPALASPRVCCFVTSRLRCTHSRHSCFLLVAMLLHCPILPLHPWWSNGPAPGAVANAKALQLALPPKPGWPVFPVIWVPRQVVGHLRQPRCPVTRVDGMISGYDYDYDYACMYVRMYVLAYVCMYVCMAMLRRGVFKEPGFFLLRTPFEHRPQRPPIANRRQRPPSTNTNPQPPIVATTTIQQQPAANCLQLPTPDCLLLPPTNPQPSTVFP